MDLAVLDGEPASMEPSGIIKEIESSFDRLGSIMEANQNMRMMHRPSPSCSTMVLVPHEDEASALSQMRYIDGEPASMEPSVIKEVESSFDRLGSIMEANHNMRMGHRPSPDCSAMVLDRHEDEDEASALSQMRPKQPQKDARPWSVSTAASSSDARPGSAASACFPSSGARPGSAASAPFSSAGTRPGSAASVLFSYSGTRPGSANFPPSPGNATGNASIFAEVTCLAEKVVGRCLCGCLLYADSLFCCTCGAQVDASRCMPAPFVSNELAIQDSQILNGNSVISRKKVGAGDHQVYLDACRDRDAIDQKLADHNLAKTRAQNVELDQQPNQLLPTTLATFQALEGHPEYFNQCLSGEDFQLLTGLHRKVIAQLAQQPAEVAATCQTGVKEHAENYMLDAEAVEAAPMCQREADTLSEQQMLDAHEAEQFDAYWDAQHSMMLTRGSSLQENAQHRCQDELDALWDCWLRDADGANATEAENAAADRQGYPDVRISIETPSWRNGFETCIEFGCPPNGTYALSARMCDEEAPDQVDAIVDLELCTQESQSFNVALHARRESLLVDLAKSLALYD